MYKELLTIRYFRRKLIALFAMLGVLMCTAMVIIVSSVMGGFLENMKSAGHSLVGDVVLDGSLTGFSHYQEIIDELKKLDQVKMATPVMQGFGLIKLPYDRVEGVQIYGINGQEMAEVTGYDDTLFWSPELFEDPRYQPYAEEYKGIDLKSAGLKLNTSGIKINPKYKGIPVIVPGLEVSGWNRRTSDGSYRMDFGGFPGKMITLTVLPISSKGGASAIDSETKKFLVVNEFKSGLYLIDRGRVYIHFDEAQEMFQMKTGPRIVTDQDGNPLLDDEGNTKTDGVVPGRCNQLFVAAAEGVTPQVLKVLVQDVVDRVKTKYYNEMVGRPRVKTWEEQQASYFAAIEKEKGLVTMLFAIISLVAVVMVGVIFYMIVLEKTKDIGILRSIGASKLGAMAIFLYYGIVIGIVGGGLGVAVAVWVVKNINSIHDWLGDGLGATVFVALCTFAVPLILLVYWIGCRFADIRPGKWLQRTAYGAMVLGFSIGMVWIFTAPDFRARLNGKLSIVIWNRAVYFFDAIPSSVDTFEVVVIFVIAVVASIVGALIPAFKASQVDPVESLRY